MDDFLNARYVNLSWRLMNLVVHSEGNNIFIVSLLFPVKRGTFLKHPLCRDFVDGGRTLQGYRFVPVIITVVFRRKSKKVVI